MPCLMSRVWFGTGSTAHVLEHDHRSAALDDAEENVVRLGPLKRDVEPKAVAIERQRRGDILDDEEGRDAGNVWFHVSSCDETYVDYFGQILDTDGTVLLRLQWRRTKGEYDTLAPVFGTQ